MVILNTILTHSFLIIDLVNLSHLKHFMDDLKGTLWLMAPLMVNKSLTYTSQIS